MPQTPADNSTSRSFDKQSTLGQAIVILERILVEKEMQVNDAAHLLEDNDDDTGRVRGLLMFLEEMGWIIRRGGNSGSRDGGCYQVTVKGRAAVKMYAGVKTMNNTPPPSS